MVIVTYKYVVEVLTPTIITSPSGYRGLSYTIVSNYINGSIVRGALFSYLLLEKLITKDIVDSETRNPSHSVSPALPVPKNMASQAIPYLDTAFAHSLSYTFKGDGKIVYSLGIDKLLSQIRKGLRLEEAFYSIINEFVIARDREAYKHNDIFTSSSETRKVLGDTIAKSGGRWIRVNPSLSVYVENAVDRARGSAAEGMLYAYEYIEPGSTFIGYISTEEKSYISKVLESIKNSDILIRIGRGIGRGYGVSKLTLTPVEIKAEDIYIESNNKFIMYAASPLVNPRGLPRPLAVSDEVELSLWDRYKVARVRIDGIISGATWRFYGWSYRTSFPKLPVEALIPGNLALVSLHEIFDRSLIDVLYVAGFSMLSSQGYNFVKILDRDFISPYTR